MALLLSVIGVCLYLAASLLALGLLCNDDNVIFNEPWAKQRGFTSDQFLMTAAALSLLWPIGAGIFVTLVGWGVFRGALLLPRVWREKRHERQQKLAEKLASTIDGRHS